MTRYALQKVTCYSLENPLAICRKSCSMQKALLLFAKSTQHVAEVTQGKYSLFKDNNVR